MIRTVSIACACGCIAAPASAAQVYNISFDTGIYSGSFGLDTVSDKIVSVDFTQGGRIWSVPDVLLYGSYVGKGVYYLIGGKPSGLSIQISPVVTDPSQNDFSLSFTLLFGSPRLTQGGVFQTQTAGRGYTVSNITVNAAPVPEPVSWAMMSLGMGLIGYTMRMRRAKVAFV